MDWRRRPELRLAEGRSGRSRAWSVDSGAATAPRLVEHAERQLGVAQRQAVAVDEPGAALLLAVDEDLALLVDLFEVEIAPVEEDLGVRFRDALALDAHVVAERATDRSTRACTARTCAETPRGGTT